MLAEFVAVKTFLIVTGSALTGTELLCQVIKSKQHKGNEKIATSKLGNVRSLKDITGNNGLRISKEIQLSQEASMQHVLVVGSSGSHKTTSLFYPNLLTEDLGKCSLIVMDAKRRTL